MDWGMKSVRIIIYICHMETKAGLAAYFIYIHDAGAAFYTVPFYTPVYAYSIKHAF